MTITATLIAGNVWQLTDDDGRTHAVAARVGAIEAEVIATWQQAMSPPTPLPTAADVRAEAERRIIALVGARDASHLDVKMSNAQREATRLLEKRMARLADPQAPDWTEAEAARAAELRSLDAAIEAIRAASNAMEEALPADFADDARWP